MKSTGMVRKIDELGRIVIPKEMRGTFDLIEYGDALEIFVDDNMIILKKYEPSCIFCKSSKDIHTFKGRNVCADCAAELSGR